MSPEPQHGQHHDAAPHATKRDYTRGFILSLLLTAIPFWLVMARPLSSATVTAAVIMAFAIVQIVVHMIYFLHMNRKAEGGWSMTALVFTVIVVMIMLAGSTWVMHHLNANMMPTMADTSQLP